MYRFILNETSYHGAGAISAIPASVPRPRPPRFALFSPPARFGAFLLFLALSG